MLLLAIATSIDALAVGIMFAFTYDSLNIYWAIAIIGLTTFVLSIIGVIVGNFSAINIKEIRDSRRNHSHTHRREDIA